MQVWCIGEQSIVWKRTPSLYLAMHGEVVRRTVARHGPAPADDCQRKEVRAILPRCSRAPSRACHICCCSSPETCGPMLAITGSAWRLTLACVVLTVRPCLAPTVATSNAAIVPYATIGCSAWQETDIIECVVGL